MRSIIIFLLLARFGYAQSTNTNCTANGNQADCNTQTQQANQNGEKLGAGLGQLAVALAIRHAQKATESFCHNNPGQVYKGYQCPTLEQAAVETAISWRDRHPKFHQCPENANVMINYMTSNNLDPTSYKSYDTAFKALKKQGKIIFNR